MDESALGAGISANDISGAIAKLREHPEIISAVASALSEASSASEPSESKDKPITSVSNPEPLPAAPTPGIPIERISEVMATLAPMLSEISGKSSLPKEIKGSREDHRYALLCALRPYLSRERREVVDQFLKFGKIGELLKKMK